MNKNIDQLLGDLDSYLKLNHESSPIDVEKIALEHKNKKLREIRGNSHQLKALFFAGIAILGLDPRIETFINMSVVALAVAILLWLHRKTKKDIAQINVAMSFNDFHEQRKKVASGLLKLYRSVRIVMYAVLFMITGANIYFYLNNPDVLSFIVYLGATLLGAFLIIRNMESVIQEYKLTIQS
ncbi:MAG: hypothetical protein ACOVP4_06040 [Bacteriovoracaceae bacterium]